MGYDSESSDSAHNIRPLQNGWWVISQKAVCNKPPNGVPQASVLNLLSFLSHSQIGCAISQQNLAKRWVISQRIDLVGDKPLVCDKPVRKRIGG